MHFFKSFTLFKVIQQKVEDMLTDHTENF